jgi:nicotinamide-nucleotide amidase
LTLSNAGRIAADAVGLLSRRRRTLAVAESSTGGLVGHLVTDVPGGSAVFLGGVIAYANKLKEQMGVPPDTLSASGAVSPEAATAMAEAVRDQTGADYGLAVTGIAGPSGGTPGKPVGLTYVAVSSASGTVAREHKFRGNRSTIKAASARAALELLWEAITRETQRQGVAERR